MATQSIELPDAILSPDEISLALDQAREAQRLASRLLAQADVFSVASLFEDHPELASFSFSLSRETHDDGSPYFCPSVVIERVGSDFPVYDKAFENLAREVEDFVGEQSNEWRFSMQDKILSRPDDPASLLDSLMRQCLSPEDFSSWQAAGLSRAASPGRRASPAKPL